MRRGGSGRGAHAAQRFIAGAILFTAAACTPAGDGPGDGFTEQGVPDTLSTAEASRFLTQATFGPRMAEIEEASRIGASAWIKRQFNATPGLHLVGLVSRENLGEDLGRSSLTDSFWQNAVEDNDQLRQRMAYALSQIVVVGAGAGSDLQDEPLAMAYYYDILLRNALGNYRDILTEVTYSPAMAIWLTYLHNQKANPRTGSVPDENYAREIMQLFTIGLVELELDGTPTAPGDVETYDNDDVIGLARVFTGLSNKSGFRNNSDDTNIYSRLVMYDDQHSEEEKTFLGLTIPAGTGGTASIDQAINHLFNHRNVAPFVSQQLIQRFTTSSPSPAYGARVATSFESGTFRLPDGTTVGTGARGDLRATIAAILLDPEARQDPATAPDGFGKVREPVLRFTHWARAFEVETANANEEWYLDDTSRPDRLGQHPLRSPSVFNFYRPQYVAPGGATGDAGLTAPEMQLVNESTAIGYVNTMSRFVRDQTPNRNGASGDAFKSLYLAETALADDPTRLVDRLDLLLTGGRMRT